MHMAWLCSHSTGNRLIVSLGLCRGCFGEGIWGERQCDWDCGIMVLVGGHVVCVLGVLVLAQWCVGVWWCWGYFDGNR